jgi:tRNA(Glu) U13 pseudouridine synthase TruD
VLLCCFVINGVGAVAGGGATYVVDSIPALKARIKDAVAGDIMHKRPGGLFDCTDPAVDTPRIAAGEIAPTGPMFGVSMRAPAEGSAAAERETQILAAAGLSREVFASVSAIAEGTRRDAAIEVTEPVARMGADGTLEVEFALPAGAYATVVMREIMKVSEEAVETPGSTNDDAQEPT